MQTRLAVFCDKLLEAGWLAALIVAPLFFDVFSSRVFEPDKITLVRSLALLMVGAWIVRQIEAGLSRTSPSEWFRSLRRSNPLILPAAAMIAVYIVSTIFSVVPSVSLWGSYQRLQGTYTTFSYIVIFLIAASSIRTRVQFDRAVNVAIVVSFPIAFYGLLQHFKLDPLPWGGDTTQRVASNMGNSIFVAAYLIMVVPLTIARLIEYLARLGSRLDSKRRIWLYAGTGVAILALAAAMVFDFTAGVVLLAALFAAGLVLTSVWQLDRRDSLLGITFALILMVQFVGIFFSQSRGPWLGLFGGLFAFAVIYSLTRGARQVILGTVTVAIVGAIFLIAFNIPGSPLEPLKRIPYVGRFGEILDTSSGTAQVRELIWQGAVKLIQPHAPLWSPTTGEDQFNAFRPLVGYGPEAMYVVYNPFYPPDLAHLESRNASPDRSHNETFDSLVTTGLLGFAAYILLFMSIFYYGLRWLGLIRTAGERNAFIALWLAGGLISSVFFGLWRGWYYLGVALPAGMIVGLLIFLTVNALRNHRAEGSAIEPRKALWVSALIAAIVGHFVEIHFGIAIVSTRTYFWFYAALLVVLGTERLREAPAPAAPAPSPAPAAVSIENRKRRRRANEPVRPANRKESGQAEIPLAPVLVSTALASLVMLTLAFEFINNQVGTPSPMDAVVRALFFLGDNLSLGVFLMFAFTWIIAGIVFLSSEFHDFRFNRNGAALAILLFVAPSLTVFVWYLVFQTRWLTQQGDLTNSFIAVLGLYYVFVLIILAALAVALSLDLLPRGAVLLRGRANVLVAPVLVFTVLPLIYLTNYTSIAADILYKSGGNSDNAGQFDQSVDTYQRALNLQPSQDFYDLFLGRAYLESARASNDPAQREQRLAKSEQTLLTAQALNPLNTDHSANLARLHRIWASLVTDATAKASHSAKSSEYYQMATRLSPNTAYLYNEWSQTYYQSGDTDKARAELEQSLKIDSQFPQTYVYLGELDRAKGDYTSAADDYLNAIKLDPASLSEADGTPSDSPMVVLARPDIAPRAVAAYRDALKRNPASTAAHLAIAEIYRRAGDKDKVKAELEQTVKDVPGDLTARLSLVNFYSENGQIDLAVNAMKPVMELVTTTHNRDVSRFQDFNAQLQNLQRAIQTAKNAPNDPAPHKALAAMWKARLQPQFALPEYQIVARLVPNDYDAAKNDVLLNLQLNRLDEAGNALNTAVALAPDSDKPLWQNVLTVINAQKAKQYDQALKTAQATLPLLPEADRGTLQAYIQTLQSQAGPTP